jgi:hypothetical protein
MRVLKCTASAGGRGIKQLAPVRRTLQRTRLAARALEHSAHCTSDQRTARYQQQRDSAAVSGWRVISVRCVRVTARKPLEGLGWSSRAARLIRSFNIHALRRETFRILQPARQRGLADSNLQWRSKAPDPSIR